MEMNVDANKEKFGIDCLEVCECSIGNFIRNLKILRKVIGYYHNP